MVYLMTSSPDSVLPKTSCDTTMVFFPKLVEFYTQAPCSADLCVTLCATVTNTRIIKTLPLTAFLPAFKSEKTLGTRCLAPIKHRAIPFDQGPANIWSDLRHFVNFSDCTRVIVTVIVSLHDHKNFKFLWDAKKWPGTLKFSRIANGFSCKGHAACKVTRAGCGRNP